MNTHTHLKTSHWPAKDGNSSFLRTAPACEEDVEDGQTSNFGLPETTCNPMRRRRKENKNFSDRSIPSSKPAQTKRSSSLDTHRKLSERATSNDKHQILPQRCRKWTTVWGKKAKGSALLPALLPLQLYLHSEAPAMQSPSPPPYGIVWLACVGKRLRHPSRVGRCFIQPALPSAHVFA